jgi:hypothetical protein
MLKFLKQIDPLWFFVSLAVGFLAVYVMAPKPQIVVKFPSPQNAGKIVYKDNSNTCFVYKADSVSCPRDKTKIKDQPISID